MNQRFCSKLKNICSAFLRGLAGRALATISFLFLIVLILGALIFYRYDIMAERAEPKIEGETILFQEELYQQILKKWQERADRFEAAGSQKYINPF